MIRITDFLNEVHLDDNLKFMKGLPDESVDLIYIDPPFYSRRDYGDFNALLNDITVNIADIILIVSFIFESCLIYFCKSLI